MASDMRFATPSAKTAFCLRVGLAGCDMGACAMLPRIMAKDVLPTSSIRVIQCQPRKALIGVFTTAHRL